MSPLNVNDSSEFACDFCGISFVTCGDLQTHIESNHVDFEECEDIGKLSTPDRPSIPLSAPMNSL